MNTFFYKHGYPAAITTLAAGAIGFLFLIVAFA